MTSTTSSGTAIKATSDTVRIGINGFGRIGRLVARGAFSSKHNICIAAINDPGMTADYMAYLFAHDSVHNRYNGTVRWEMKDGNSYLIVDEHHIPVFSCKDPKDIPWGQLGVEMVAETSGVFTTTDKAKAHLDAGAKKVVISAPSKDCTPMLVMGVNHENYCPATMHIVSNASCTTNCLAPLAKIVHEAFGIEEGLMTTIHAATASQRVVDAPCRKDWRAGRSVLCNIIPASTGAAVAVGEVIPALSGRLTGLAFRVPVADVSVLDLTCRLSRPVASIADIIDAVNSAVEGQALGKIIGVTTEQVVSTDFRGDPRSCVLDAAASIVLNPTFVKLVAFYDNEWGYSERMLDLMAFMKCKAGE